MVFSSIKTFHDAIKPLVFLNCHAGMGAFRQPNQSDAEYFFMNLYTVFISLLNWAVTYVALTFISRAPNFHDSSPMAVTMYTVLLYTNSSITVIGPFIVWLRRKGLRECLRKMPILDETFQAVLGAQHEYRKEYIRLICRVIATCMVMTVLSVYDTTWSLEYSPSLWTSFSVIMTQHHPIFVMFVLDLNFCTFVEYLEKKFRQLNDALLRLANKPESASYPGERLTKIPQNMLRRITRRNKIKNMEAESLVKDMHYPLQEIRKAHLELCKLTRQVNSVFGMQNLLSSGISFGMITGLSYTTYSAFVWKRRGASNVLKDIVPPVMWAAIYIVKTWMISHSCSRISYEAQSTGEVIYEFLKLKVNEEIQSDQIKLFALQMLQNPIRFDACGFFILDHTFIQGMIGSITTYLVILIQISQLSERTTIALNPFKNATQI